MKTINEDIKQNTYHRAYLLYGEEEYLKHAYLDKLLKALNPDGDTMNFSRFSGKNQNEGEIIDLAETMPFFADHRVIVLEDTGMFKNKTDALADYMAELPDYLILIWSESEVDKRSRMYKALSKAGYAAEFKTQTAESLARWVLQGLKQEGKQITQKNMDLFLSMTGSDMGQIRMELDKLLSYTIGKKVIEAGDIEAICTRHIENQIFDMIRAVSAHQQKKALAMYYDLLALREPPMRILYLLGREFSILRKVKELTGEGAGSVSIASSLGLRPFVVKNYLSMVGNYTADQLRAAVEDFVQTEQDVKTGKLEDKLSVELMIIKYSKKES